MKKLKVPLIIGAVFLILALLKVFFLTPSKPGQTGTTGGVRQPVPVTGYIVKNEILNNEVYSSGTISANEEAELRPEVSGKITYLNLVEGGRVSEGTLLVKINDADLQAQLKKLQLQVKLAEEREARQRKLLEISGVSQEEYDIVLNALTTARADVENMMAQIAKTEIRAPFSGVLGLRKISVGAYVSPATLIATMQQIDPVKVDFSVPEKYMDLLKKGDKVFFSVQGLADTFTAKIYAIDPKIDLATRTIQLRALAPNKNTSIFPGAFTRVQLVLDQNKSAIMVPTESIVPVLKGQKVYLYKNGTVREQIVETGIRTSERIEVVSGLQLGDTVIVTGVMSIRQEAPVKMIRTF